MKLRYLLLLIPFNLFSEDRFPRPDFESGYIRPVDTYIGGDLWFLPYIDIAVLIILLILGIVAIYKWHKRVVVLILSLIALIYFGFIRKGCVCSVGAIQPITEAIFNSSIVLPLSSLLFFIIPIIVSLFYGRVYCGVTCPLGTLQDLVSIKKLSLPGWLEGFLSLIPPLFLGLALISAGLGSDYLICRLDPFVNIFKLSGTFNSIIYTAFFVISSIVFYRPYCRFLCPYGFLLKLVSKLSLKRVKITKKECINCDLCRNSCPMGQIDGPSDKKKKGPKRAGVIIALFPLIIIVLALSLRSLTPLISRLDYRVALNSELEKGVSPYDSDRVEAFLSLGESSEELKSEVNMLINSYRLALTILGALLGLYLGIKVIKILRKRSFESYEIDRGGCVHCARCFESCPLEVGLKYEE